jgi:hypothetical protein
MDSTTQNADGRQEAAIQCLEAYQSSLQSLCNSVEAFAADASRHAYTPPIIDNLTVYGEVGITGLSKFAGFCNKELSHHDFVSPSSS